MIRIPLYLLVVQSFLILGCPSDFRDKQNTTSDDPFLEQQYLNIFKKVIKFLEENPSKINYSLERLLNENVISQDEYEFLKENQIVYNPPGSAGPYDNYLSIFDRNNEDGTSSHILYTLVADNDPSITRTTPISGFKKYLLEWFEFHSDRKNLTVYKNDNTICFTASYTNNEYWNKQHRIRITFPIADNKRITVYKRIISSHNLSYRENFAQGDIDITVLLPPDFAAIERFCLDVITIIYSLESSAIIRLSSDGFRFKQDLHNK